jgi:murein DD-endopeptidase MepM/ murein hydrolase activator NlpD
MSTVRELLQRADVGRLFEFDIGKVVVLDLTAGNAELRSFDISSPKEFGKYVQMKMLSIGASAAIGRYNEDRVIYRRSPLFGTERSIHLGIDIFLPAGTKVLAPLDATIHSVRDNKGFGDYGPTIILQHTFGSLAFYTLYGHLSRGSLIGMGPGMSVRKGEVIGEIGTPDVNGNWPMHVHFQIIGDMEGRSGDFPGVSSHSNRAHYLKLCPDPNLILRLDALDVSS